MGILWTVWPLDDDMRGWLSEQNISHPDCSSRFPTGLEIKAVLSRLEDYDVQISDTGLGAPWQASIVHKSGGEMGPWTMMTVQEYSGDELPQELYFKKGWESLIREVVRSLAAACGPLVLLPDSGGEPALISA